MKIGHCVTLRFNAFADCSPIGVEHVIDEIRGEDGYPDRIYPKVQVTYPRVSEVMIKTTCEISGEIQDNMPPLTLEDRETMDRDLDAIGMMMTALRIVKELAKQGIALTGLEYG